MPASEVMKEAERLVASGVKWITLLGQNVNSYAGQGPRTKSHGQISGEGSRTTQQEPWTVGPGPWTEPFPRLLEMLCGIKGLERISFTTSHPQDATEELFQVIARNPKIGRRFHLPLQSGSDRVLKRMKRRHTFAEYESKVRRLRELVPEIAITTDIIVGFSGERDEDHEATKRALEVLRFDSAFIYKYSVRPGTPADRLPDDVLPEEKAARNQELLAIQKRISEEKSRAMVGSTRTIFVEQRHLEESQEYVGRLDQDRRVIFESDRYCVGEFLPGVLTELQHETFRAKPAL